MPKPQRLVRPEDIAEMRDADRLTLMGRPVVLVDDPWKEPAPSRRAGTLAYLAMWVFIAGVTAAFWYAVAKVASWI